MNLTFVPSRIQQTLEPVVKRFFAPQKLSRLVTRAPQKLNRKIVEKILNSVFAEQINEGDFDFLENRSLQIEIIDARLFVGLSYNLSEITCQSFNNTPFQSDVTLSVNTVDAIQLVQQEVDPDTLFFQRKLKIRGDTELAHHVKNTIDTLDPEAIPMFAMKLISNYRLRVLEPETIR